MNARTPQASLKRLGKNEAPSQKKPTTSEGGRRRKKECPMSVGRRKISTPTTMRHALGDSNPLLSRRRGSVVRKCASHGEVLADGNVPRVHASRKGKMMPDGNDDPWGKSKRRGVGNLMCDEVVKRVP
jgi:hypothetical protein